VLALGYFGGGSEIFWLKLRDFSAVAIGYFGNGLRYFGVARGYFGDSSGIFGQWLGDIW